MLAKNLRVGTVVEGIGEGEATVTEISEMFQGLPDSSGGCGQPRPCLRVKFSNSEEYTLAADENIYDEE